jgi:hypothetical protein
MNVQIQLAHARQSVAQRPGHLLDLLRAGQQRLPAVQHHADLIEPVRLGVLGQPRRGQAMVSCDITFGRFRQLWSPRAVSRGWSGSGTRPPAP